MGKIIGEHIAMLINVESTHYEPDNEWMWRTDLIGRTGYVEIYDDASEKGQGNVHIAFFDDGGFELKTGYGKIMVGENILTLTTKRSIYTFEIINEKNIGNQI